jgi:membrane-bound metal-dependent hydrolase YbcI (DUF457 family)
LGFGLWSLGFGLFTPEVGMKGIAHFITGVAIATFFPEVVQQAAGGSVLPMLGGIAGILPDTLDFKFARYFERYDLEIDPGPEPDARDIAEQVVGAMRKAYDTRKPQNIMLHTIRLGADLWRQYTIRFDPEQNEVAMRIGPVVNTGQVPLPGSEPEEAEEVRVKVGVPMVHTYDAENRIDIFSGPSFKFERRGDKLHVHFLDWHRRWSHSLTLAAAIGLVAGLLLGKWAGVVAGLGFAGHVLEDQLGFMGSNLFYPFTKGRSTGLQLLRSAEPVVVPGAGGGAADGGARRAVPVAEAAWEAGTEGGASAAGHCVGGGGDGGGVRGKRAEISPGVGQVLSAQCRIAPLLLKEG